MTLSEFLGVAFIAAGTFFSVVGIIGMMRLPDVYTRIHASGKVSTLGLLGLLVGAALLMPEITLKALALAVFLLITMPAAAHAIVASAHRQGVARANLVRDDLEAASGD